jgi:hypothetical protein
MFRFKGGFFCGSLFSLGTGKGSLSTRSDGYPPQITIPSTQVTNEDTNKSITGISITDVDSTFVYVTDLSVNHGTLTLAQTTGLTFTTGDGTADIIMAFSGTKANVNAALATLTYSPTANYNGSDTVEMTVFDGTHETSTVLNITVTSVNDAPILTVPGAQTVDEDDTLDITGISVADVDATNITVTNLSVTNGTLSLAQLTGLSFTTGDGTGDAVMAFSGTKSNVNAAIATITYAPTGDYNGPDTLSITVSDGSLTDTDTVSITVTPVADGPTINLVDSSFTFDEDVGGNITGVSITSVESPVTMTFESDHFWVWLSGTTTGITFTDPNQSNLVSGTGSVSNWNTALENIAFLPNGSLNYNGPDSITITLDDGINDPVEEIISITITPVDDAATLVFPTTTPLLVVKNLANSIPLTINDVDSATISLRVNATHGVINLSSLTGITFTSGNNGEADITFNGSVANMQAATVNIIYTPDTDYVGDATITFGVNGTYPHGAVTLFVDVINTITVNMSSLNTRYTNGASQSIEFQMSGDITGNVGPISLDGGGFSTASGFANVIKTALNGIGYSYINVTGVASGTVNPSGHTEKDSYSFTIRSASQSGTTLTGLTNPPTATTQRLAVALRVDEDMVTQGVSPVAGYPPVVQVTASGSFDISSDNQGNSVSLDFDGNFSAATPAAGWTASANIGTSVQFTAPSNYTITGYGFNVGGGSASVIVSGAPDYSGVQEAHRLKPRISHTGGESTGAASGYFSPAAAGMPIPYNSDAMTIASSISSNFGGDTASVSGDLTSGSGAVATATTAGDKSDTALSPTGAPGGYQILGQAEIGVSIV